MKLHAPPFDSVTDEMLHGLAMGGEACTVEVVIVGSVLVGLVTPLMTAYKGKIRYGLACLTATGATDPSLAAFFTETGADNAGQAWTADSLRAQGLPLGHLGCYEIKGQANLERFVIVSADGVACELRIQYYW